MGLVTKDQAMPDVSCYTGVTIVERLPGYGLNNGSNFDISHKRQPARAPTVLFCVRYRKAELGFNMFIISHIAIACQDEIFTVVVYTM